ncbi:hypothetical protein FZD47_17275 [Bacillus infantis]|uniref:Uncharacterized protein n=1 Tax=Bacillus infantis TaxID=324767 RepID=A0A5D4SFG2_9BACI|nr:hypothetical protein [Bacillus infantis]TYS61849.1 hypothetical protein FZD47_17275 [Bacillus infantis]
MKKIIFILAAIALLLVLFITVNFMKTTNNTDQNESIEQTQPESGPSEEAWDPDAAPEQVAKVEGATTTFPVDQSSAEKRSHGYHALYDTSESHGREKDRCCRDEQRKC